jgi:hypothetical protein
VAVTALVSLVLHGFPRIREVDLRNLTMTLDQIENTKHQIYATAEDLKRASLVLADLILFTSEVGSRYGSEEDFNLQKQWKRRKCNLLLEAFGASAQERGNLFRYADFFRRFDEASPEERKGLDVNAMVTKDLEEMEGTGPPQRARGS